MLGYVLGFAFRFMFEFVCECECGKKIQKEERESYIDKN